MSVLFIALPIALLLAGAAIAAFVWAVRGGQFDDLDTPAWRVIVDDDESSSPRGAVAESDEPPPHRPSSPR